MLTRDRIIECLGTFRSEVLTFWENVYNQDVMMAINSINEVQDSLMTIAKNSHQLFHFEIITK